MKRLSLIALAALSLFAATGCISRRTGYAVLEEEPALGTPYWEVLARLGNPTAVRPFAKGNGFEAVWSGTATRGGGVKVGYYGVGVRFGRTRNAVHGRRMTFDAYGRLIGSWPVGPDEPAWGWVPFGAE